MTSTRKISNVCVFCLFLFVLSVLTSGFSFIDPKTEVKSKIIEMNGTTSLTISCRTTDLNANVTLVFGFTTLPVGGRVTLDKQVFTIHNLSTHDEGMYECRARNIKRTIIVIPVQKEKMACCPTVTPKSKVIEAGTSMNFTCKVAVGRSLRKYLTFKWFKEDSGTYVEVTDSETHRETVNSFEHSVLTIKNPKPTPQSGILYKCQISYRGRMDSYRPRLKVVSGLSTPNITFLKEAVTIVEQKQLMLICEALSFPVATITWIHNGTEMSLCLQNKSDDCIGKNYKVIQTVDEELATSRSYLIIVKTKYPKDNGNYTCVATNSKNSDKKSMEVSIETEPSLVKSESFWTTNRVYCQVSRSNPLPVFKWQYQNGPCLNINPECNPDSSKWKDVPSGFVISPPGDVPTARSTVDVPKDLPSGFLRCKATNTRGSDENVMRVFVSGVDSVKITTASKEYDEDQTLKVRCVMICKGTMTGWYKDGQQLLTATDTRVNITWEAENDRTWTNLVVEKLTAYDSGVYTCGAHDCHGHPLNASEVIKVNKVFPPVILNFENQTVYDQTAVELYCNISAHPTPRVQWFKDSYSLEDKIKDLDRPLPCRTSLKQGFYRVKNVVGKLIICSPVDASHTGFYTCSAANRKGKSNATAFLDVLEIPVVISPTNETVLVELGKPWNISCEAQGNPEPTLEWKTGNKNALVTRKQHSSNGIVLSFKSVSEQDLGMYFCVAMNSKGVAYAYVELESDNLPSTAPTEVLSQEIIIALSVVGVLLFLFFVVTVVCCVFFRRQRQQIKEYHSQFFPITFEHSRIDPTRTLQDQCDNLAYDPDWEFPLERLILGEVLGSGAFGQVIKAEAIGIADFNPRDKSTEKVKRRSKMLRRLSSSRMYQDSKGMPYVKTTVAVKTLKEGAQTAEFSDLASELKILIHVGEHKNIVNLLGACTKSERLMIIMEYAPHGNLLKFLRSKREIYEPIWITTTNNPDVELTIRNLVAFSYQISRGMEFLASRKCIHRDLAARNVLVGEDYVMKVADFGLARNIYQSDMYVRTGNGVLPIKWMALESLFDRVYTEKSDVWSFGICLWEIFTLGGTPYPMLPTEQVMDMLSNGDRMEQPHNCPLDMYVIMRDCWEQNPESRPTFAQLSERIGRIIELHTSKETTSAYVSITGDNRPGNDYYVTPYDSGPTLPQTGFAGLNRQSSEDIAHSPFPSLPRDAETEQELEPDERQRILEHGSLSGNESGISLEEGSDEAPAVAELKPLRDSSRSPTKLTVKEKQKTRSKETLV